MENESVESDGAGAARGQERETARRVRGFELAIFITGLYYEDGLSA